MRSKNLKKKIYPKDTRYDNELAGRFINKVMLDGKKSIAEDMFYEALESAAKTVEKKPVEFLDEAINNVRPSLEVRPRRVGGANYNIPMPVSPVRQESLAIRWLVDSARSKSGKSFSDLLKRELLDAFNKKGDAFNKKMNMEKMAEANKAFAHFRW